ncbi:MULTISPECIES: M48 family metallopeptidase [unclassified Moorena]|uniref:M48 family metallopeptidase n=1 Tax=unclassified Moorena TaxID=2683338 RepID=UPI0013B844DD|nr:MULTISPECIES: M48 family metallopeptidase [unclassified Moorena]NEP33762.1 M48 family metallopeptidase [Moorena sp. SIO3B2]NEQ16326.1 M48 family metallopeptidase [Moorena sp. SIO3E2]NER91247.1 M48 family metallopeptidase [Moorena sp. SIO3A2]NES82906.1 M48 family metallopeptidase [Moorena sp. SIO2B7]
MPSPDIPQSRNPPPSNRQLLILLGLFISFIVGVIWLLNLLINSLIGLIPPSVEQKLGAVIVPVYEQQAQPSPTQETLNQLLARLEKQLPPEQSKQRDYRVLYLPEDTVNALALPGDVIVVYAGFLKQVESENELMMVLGHELGHFAHRDHLRSLGRRLLVRTAIAYFVGDVGALESLAISGLATLSKSKFSQSQEQQADEFGLRLLQQTYGHVAGATDFFARMSHKRGASWDFLSSHPSPGKRVTRLQRLIKEQNYPLKERSPLPENLNQSHLISSPVEYPY